MMKLENVLMYLRNTSELSIAYGSGGNENDDELVRYVDADHAGDPDENYPTTGCAFDFAGGPLIWKSRRQKLVSLFHSGGRVGRIVKTWTGVCALTGFDVVRWIRTGPGNNE